MIDTAEFWAGAFFGFVLALSLSTVAAIKVTKFGLKKTWAEPVRDAHRNRHGNNN